MAVKSKINVPISGTMTPLHPETEIDQIIGLARQNSTAYTVGAVAFAGSLPSPLVLKCTTAGTTAATAPDFSGAVEGGTVTDGTVVWTYKTLVGGGLDADQIPAVNKREVITTSGTYTAPVDGWYRITVKGGGGGGGGAFPASSTQARSGNGGGEGGMTIGYEYMSAGDTATVIIGAGGTGGAVNADGTNGGDSSATVGANTYIGGGGNLGTKWGSSSMSSGAGGTGTIVGAAGGAGTNGYQTLTLGGSGGGVGGGTSSLASTSAGTQGGGGAGGAGAHSGGGTSRSGSAGGDGFVLFEYFDISLNP